MRYGEAMVLLLDARGMTKYELAQRIGKSRSYVSQLGSGKIKEPSLTVAFAIADALGVPVDVFRKVMDSDRDEVRRILRQINERTMMERRRGFDGR